jgi:hypothetical protein
MPDSVPSEASEIQNLILKKVESSEEMELWN